MSATGKSRPSAAKRSTRTKKNATPVATPVNISSDDDDNDNDNDSTKKGGKAAPKHAKVKWEKNPNYTWEMISAIETDTQLRRTLFSDSAKTANAEGRCKTVARTGKKYYHSQLAERVFAQQLAACKTSALRVSYTTYLTTAVGSRLTKLRK